ncbi:hypothetical protein [Caudoviricetes sp.]|nr:hypothetical protein [Caudoviricetes sp.]
MAKYRVKERSFINNSIVEEGEIVEYSGRPGSNLEPLSSDDRTLDPVSEEAGAAGAVKKWKKGQKGSDAGAE